MQGFPKIETDQVVLLRANKNNGHILDEEFKLSVNDSQMIYTVFNSLDESLMYIKNILTERNDIEFVVYDSKKNVIQFI